VTGKAEDAVPVFFSATTLPFVPFVTRHNIMGGKERFVALGIV